MIQTSHSVFPCASVNTLAILMLIANEIQIHLRPSPAEMSSVHKNDFDLCGYDFFCICFVVKNLQEYNSVTQWFRI